MQTFWKFIKGILLRGESSDPTDNLEGSLWYNSTSDRFKGYAESAVREVVTTDQTQTLSNKTLSGSTITDPVITVEDVNFTLQDNADNTKQVKFQLANIGTGVTRTYVTPNSDGELTVNEATQTLLNKTIDGDLNTVQDLALSSLKTVLGDANEVLHRDGAGAVTSSNTMPSGTIVGTTDTQTLTNKTIDGDNNTVQDLALASLKTELGSANTVVTRNGSGAVVSTKASPTGDFVGTTDTQTLTNKTITSPTMTVLDANLTIQDNVDPTKQAKFEASGITTGTTRTYALPDANTTIVGTDASQTLTNKTINNSNSVTTLDANFTLQDNADSTKQVKFQLANIGTGTTRTYVTPNTDGELTINEATQTLLNKTLTSPTVTTGLVDNGLDFIEETSFTNPAAGNRRFGLKTDGKLYLRDSSGNEKVIGEGSSSGINYIDNPDAETDTTGWATYADAAQATPVDGTGGSPNVTWTRTTSTPLRGTGSFLFTKDAANRQGQGVAYAFTIDDADKGQVLTISMDYEIASGTYASGDLTVYIYDVTNGIVIQPSGYSVANVGVESRQVAYFQSSINSTSYRLILHVASTSASAYTVKIDNVVTGPDKIVQGTPATDWVSYVPTLNSNTNVSTNTGSWRRVGDSMELMGSTVYSGAGDNSAYFAQIPAGYTIDTAKIPTASSESTPLGAATFFDSGVGAKPATSVYRSSGTNSIYITHSTAGVVNTNTMTVGDRLQWMAKVPIVGWSSNVQMSSDTDTRVVAARYERGTSLSIPDATFTTLPFLTKSFDTHESYNTTTGIYTVPVSGIYRVSTAVAMASSANWADGEQLIVVVLKNGSQFAYTGQMFIQDGGTILTTASGSTTVQCNAGDTLQIQVLQNSGAALNTEADGRRNHLAIERLSGPAAISASETVEATATTSAGQALTAATAATIVWGTILTNTHGALNSGTGVFTVPISGKYLVCCSWSTATTSFAQNDEVATQFRKNGVVLYRDAHFFNSAASTLHPLMSSHIIQCLAGDTLDVQAISDKASSIVTTATRNSLHIIRVGNY